MTAPDALIQFVQPWSEFYADSRLVPVLVIYGHIAALVLSGGLAITMDRATLRTAGRANAEARTRHLDELARAHRVVVSGLGVSLFTGILLFAADLEVYFGSWIYWTKMALIALLLVNGYRMTRIERRLRSDTSADAWPALRTTAVLSLILWFLIPFVGVALAMAY